MLCRICCLGGQGVSWLSSNTDYETHNPSLDPWLKYSASADVQRGPTLTGRRLKSLAPYCSCVIAARYVPAGWLCPMFKSHRERRNLSYSGGIRWAFGVAAFRQRRANERHRPRIDEQKNRMLKKIKNSCKSCNYTTYMSQNFRLFLVSIVSILNFRIFCSCILGHRHCRGGPNHSSSSVRLMRQPVSSSRH